MRKGLILLLAAVAWSGCSEGSFLQRRFDNFTAHYNKFYNAKRLFGTGVRAIKRQERPVDLERYIPVFLAQEQASRSQEFEKAITKSADILRSHPRSKWVDNALMLIGKSYFYQQEYVGAEQKFREVISLGGPLADEARFWLARTLVGARALEDAEVLLDESLALDDLGKRWEALLRLVKGELYVQARDWEAAAGELEAGLKVVHDNTVASRAQFLLGQVYESMGRYIDAADSYARVERYKPLYELSYAAQVSEIRMRGLHGQADRALALLRRMKRDDKHFSYLAQLEMLQARVEASAGMHDEAFALYDELLYDPDSKATALKGRLHYNLAELYRDGYRDYFLAASHFDTAATNLRTNRTSQELLTPYAIGDAREKADTFKSFRSVAERIMRCDSLMALGALDDAAFDSAVAAIQQARIREAERKRAELARRMAENRFRSAMGQTSTTRQASGGGAADYGFLNYKDQDRFQEGLAQFKELWGDRPRVDNWRRKSAISAALALRAAEGGEEAADAEGMGNDLGMLVTPLDLSEVPRDSTSWEAMRNERAAARYELANVLFLSMNMPDSAATWYREVIEEDQGLEVAKRAYFALAEVQLALGDTTSANRLYREIVSRSPDSDFATRSRERLNLPGGEQKLDSLAMAQEAYDRAYRAWQAGRHEEALEDMLHLAVSYPKLQVAAQALLASGLIYTQRALLEDLDPVGPIDIRDGVLPPPPDSVLAMLKERKEARRDSARKAPSNETPEVAEADSSADGGQTETPPVAAGATGSQEGPAAPGTQVADSTAGSPKVAERASGRPGTAPSASGAASAERSGATVADYYVGEVVPQPLTVETIYASVRKHFPRTPYADRAERLAKYVEEQRAAKRAAEEAAAAKLAAETAPDSTAETAPDSTAEAATSAGLAADSLGVAAGTQAPAQAPARVGRIAPAGGADAQEDPPERPPLPAGSPETAPNRSGKPQDEDAGAVEATRLRRPPIRRPERGVPPDSTATKAGTPSAEQRLP